MSDKMEQHDDGNPAVAETTERLASEPANADDIRAAAAKCAPYLDVIVESWGGMTVRLKKLGAIQGVELGRMFTKLELDEQGQPVHDADLAQFYARLLKLSVVNADGTLPFNNAEGEDFWLKQPLEVLNELAPEAIKLNGFDRAAKKK